jgi:hypothetical protein
MGNIGKCAENADISAFLKKPSIHSVIPCRIFFNKDEIGLDCVGFPLIPQSFPLVRQWKIRTFHVFFHTAVEKPVESFEYSLYIVEKNGYATAIVH